MGLGAADQMGQPAFCLREYLHRVSEQRGSSYDNANEFEHTGYCRKQVHFMGCELVALYFEVRSYLIKKGVDYVEINPSHPRYEETIMQKVGYFTVPVLETPEGDVIADSTEIMEFLEPRFPNPPMLPEDKTLAALTRLIHSFGSEGLTKSAMYLRWNTSLDNRIFARSEFGRTLSTPELAHGFAVAMRDYLPILGVGLDHGVDMAIKESLEKLYDTLNAHFLKYPYILGGVPSMADYGLMGPLYAHHGRDISSSNAMKMRAPALYRWIETMLRPPVVDPEVWQVPQEYFAVDDLPDTLLALLKLIGENFVPEILATISLYHQWLESEAKTAGAIVDIEGKRDATRCWARSNTFSWAYPSSASHFWMT